MLCQDCHTTIDSEEFGKELAPEARGLSYALLVETQVYATQYDKKEGYLLSTRGNPLGNVVRDGKKVTLHSATGLDFQIPLPKQLAKDNG